MTITVARLNLTVDSLVASSRYVALFTAAPDPTLGGGTEVTGGATGYVRANLTSTTAASNGVRTFAAEWPSPALMSWGTVTHYGIMVTNTVGDLDPEDFIGYDSLAAPLLIDPNMRPLFLPGMIELAVTDGPCP